MSLICWFRGMYRTIVTGEWDIYVEGHDFCEVDHGQPECVQILECETCGVISVGWERE